MSISFLSTSQGLAVHLAEIEIKLQEGELPTVCLLIQYAYVFQMRCQFAYITGLGVNLFQIHSIVSYLITLYRPNVAAVLLRVRKVLGSNLSPQTGYPD
jgi:hypothetical protein